MGFGKAIMFKKVLWLSNVTTLFQEYHKQIIMIDILVTVEGNHSLNHIEEQHMRHGFRLKCLWHFLGNIIKIHDLRCVPLPLASGNFLFSF